MAMDGVQSTAAGGQKLDAALNSVDQVLLALQDACAPVQPIGVDVARAVGLIAAQDYVAHQPIPLQDEALVEGRAVASVDLIGASSLSPAFAMNEPPAVRVGDPVPGGCDCVIDDSLVVGAQGIFEIQGAAAPGDGVRRAGEDVGAGAALLRAGERITLWHMHILEAAGCSALEVRRPRVRVVAASRSGDGATGRLIATLARSEGMDVEVSTADESFATALHGDWDAALVLGGCGVSVDDRAVEALRNCGRVIAHGFALDPGRMGAAAVVSGRPVICLPGRFESALALYLALARPLLRYLSIAEPLASAAQAPLARKIASSVGVAQVCLLASADGAWAPLAVGDVTLAGLLRAEAYMIITQGSEGFAEGAIVRPLMIPGRSACA